MLVTNISVVILVMGLSISGQVVPPQKPGWLHPREEIVKDTESPPRAGCIRTSGMAAGRCRSRAGGRAGHLGSGGAADETHPEGVSPHELVCRLKYAHHPFEGFLDATQYVLVLSVCEGRHHIPRVRADCHWSARPALAESPPLTWVLNAQCRRRASGGRRLLPWGLDLRPHKSRACV